jgi:hypothetical protein
MSFTFAYPWLLLALLLLPLLAWLKGKFNRKPAFLYWSRSQRRATIRQQSGCHLEVAPLDRLGLFHHCPVASAIG